MLGVRPEANITHATSRAEPSFKVTAQPRPVFSMIEADGTVHAAMVVGQRKTILRKRGNRNELQTFDLVADPAERRPLATTAAAAEALQTWRKKAIGTTLPFEVRDNYLADALRGDFIAGRRAPPPAADVERLRSLGYVD